METPYYWKKGLYQEGIFHIYIVVFPIARERGNLLFDNISINQMDSC